MDTKKPALIPPIEMPYLPHVYFVNCKHYRPPSRDVIVDDSLPVALIDTIVELRPDSSILNGSMREQLYIGVCPECGQEYHCVISSHN